MISSKDVSVVVQGAISKEFTARVLKSIRKYLPRAEIILSTWKGSNVDGLDYDRLVENKDPGAEVLFPQWNQYHNLNRQLVSTKNGIAKATRKYILKTRTDIEMTGNGFLKYFDMFPKRCDELKFLKKRVVICQHYVRRPEILPFHFSDWVCFGLKNDIKDVWNVPLPKEPEMTKWFYTHNLLPQHKDPQYPFNFFRHRYCAEQYIWSEFLRKHMKLNFDNMFDVSFENSRLTDISFANNLIILSQPQFGINFLKLTPVKEHINYNFDEWQDLYKRYCDPSYKPIHEINYVDVLKMGKYLDKLKNHKNNFKKDLKGFFKSAKGIIRHPFSMGYYLIKTGTRAVRYLPRLNCHNPNLTYEQNHYFESIIDVLPKGIKEINVLMTASGEMIQFASIYDDLMAKKNQKVATVISSKSSAVLFDMISKTPFIFVPHSKVRFNDNIYFYKGRQFNIFFSDAFWFTLWPQKIHFITAMCQYLGISPKTIKPYKLDISSNAQTTLLEKCKKIKLKLDKFVIISPEANSIDPLPDSFWEKLIKEYRQKGYDVFENTTNPNNVRDGVKSCFLTYEEAYLLASRAQAIVGLRSGFLELFYQLKVPQHILYTPVTPTSRNVHLLNVVENYTLKQYPGASVKNIYEYEYTQKNQSRIIKRIMNDTKSGK